MLRLGFDVGGTKVAAGLVDGEGHLLVHNRIDARPDLSAESKVEHLVDQGMALLRDAAVQPADVSAVGLGMPGDLDPETGRLRTIPNLPAFVGLSPTELFGDAFTRRTGAHCTVVADNDTVAAVLAEARFGAGRGAQRLLYMTVSTGVGGARYDGQQAQNIEPGLSLHPDPARPELNLEELAGGNGMARRARHALRALDAEGGLDAIRSQTRILEYIDAVDHLTARHLGEAAAAGDAWARGLLGEAADGVAAGLAMLLDQGWGEECIVMGGSVALRVDGFLDRVRLGLTERQGLAGASDGLGNFDVDSGLVEAGLGEERGILGAVLFADLTH